MKRQQGFTLVELLMAMAVFSFMLLVITTGFITVVRINQSGLASRATQQNARTVVDQVVRDVRVASKAAVANGTNGNTSLCLTSNSGVVQYALDGSGNLHRAVVAVMAVCKAAPVAGAVVVNDTGVEVPVFFAATTDPVTATNGGTSLGTVMVTISIASRDDVTNLNPVNQSTHTLNCKPGNLNQFCAVTNLSSGADLRGTGAL